MPSLCVPVHSWPQQGVPAQTVRFDSHPSSAAGAAGCEQFPQPAWHVELQTPPVQASVAVLAELHARPQPPHAAVDAMSVSQPVAGLPEQFSRPVLQVRLQLVLHVPSMALQQVEPQTVDPWLRGYEQGEPSTQVPCMP
jgi:hypothetical protein